MSEPRAPHRPRRPLFGRTAPGLPLAGISPLVAGWLLGLLGLGATLVAGHAGPGPLGAAAGAVAAMIACWGYGAVLGRWLGGPRAAASSAVLGLAALILLGTALGQLSLFTRSTQQLVIAIGLAFCAVPPLRRRLPELDPASPDAFAPTLSRTLKLLALAAAALPLGLEALDLAPVLGDGANYAMEIARLWQTGYLGQQGDGGGLAGQLGGQLAASGLFALGGGLLSVGLFDAGAAAALLVLLLAEATVPLSPGEGSVRARTERLALFALLALPIVFHADVATAPTARWSATLLCIAGFLRLRRAVATGRRDGGMILLVAAMVALRIELALLATALLVGALALPRPSPGAESPATATPTARPAHRARLGVLLGWLAVVLTLQAAMRPQLGAGLLAAAALLLALPIGAGLALVALRLAGFAPWRDELSAAAVGAFSTSLLGATGLAGSMQQVVFAAWFGLLVMALTLAFGASLRAGDHAAAASRPPSSDLQLASLRGPMGLVLAAAVGITVLAPNLHGGRRDRMVSRVGRTLGASTELYALGYDRLGDSGVLELQQRTPAGARLGFWGAHPSGFDYRRNPVRDVSWPRDVRVGTAFLTPLSADLLRQLDFVIIESVKKRLSGNNDPWGATELGAIGKVQDSLELVAQARSARLYRVRR